MRFGKRTYVMGIINMSPESFSGDGFIDHDSAISMAKTYIDQGADIIDVGGESTRPGAVRVSDSEELKRVVPVIESIRSKFPDTLISIDTMKSPVAEQAIKAGANIINDIPFPIPR